MKRACSIAAMQAEPSTYGPLVASAPARERYDGVAMALHWLLALLLTGTFCVGLAMTEPPLTPTRLKLYNWHKWAGISILLLSTLRLAWRLSHRPPPLPVAVQAAMSPLRKTLFASTHRLLYALFFAVPLAGWAYSSASGFPVVWLGVLPLPDFVPVDKLLAGTLRLLHVACAFTLAAMVLLHVVATFKHQWVDRDGLLWRMLPAPRRRPTR